MVNRSLKILNRRFLLRFIPLSFIPNLSFLFIFKINYTKIKFTKVEKKHEKKIFLFADLVFF